MRGALLVATTLALVACQAVGPLSVPRDRMDYADPIGQSWKQQMLLSIVKLRYLDTPVSLDISSVVTSYSLGGEVRLGGTFYTTRTNSNETNGTLGASGIRSGHQRPADAFAAVHYRGYWFWVDDRDLDSKRMFMFLMMFSSLSESGKVPQAPILTIPTR